MHSRSSGSGVRVDCRRVPTDESLHFPPGENRIEVASDLVQKSVSCVEIWGLAATILGRSRSRPSRNLEICKYLDLDFALCLALQTEQRLWAAVEACDSPGDSCGS